MAKDATKMLSRFLFHVLKENQAIIARQIELQENAKDKDQKILKQEQEEKYWRNAVFSIREFVKYSILTNTYQEAREWIDTHKSEF